MIKENIIVFSHPPQIISRCVIAHSGPARYGFGDEIVPGVGGWLLLNEPATLHMKILDKEWRPACEIFRSFQNLSTATERRGYKFGNRLCCSFDNSLSCSKIDIMPRLPFISFEGTEGCGKSTQVRRLASRFEALRIPVLVTREPGGTPIGETIRDLLQFAPHGAAMTPETELLLFEASRGQLVRETIKPALARGVCVISDRFFDSTTVYQGVARKLDLQVVESLNAFSVGDCIPDVTFVLDVDVATAHSRMQRPRRPDRMEQEPTEFYEQVRQAYRQLAARERKRIVLIDGSGPADEIEIEIWETISSRFPALAMNPQSAIKASPARTNPQL
jgi:dTMP kinase